MPVDVLLSRALLFPEVVFFIPPAFRYPGLNSCSIYTAKVPDDAPPISARNDFNDQSIPR
jgi:hypothetical protein